MTQNKVLHSKQTALSWAKANLFNRWYNSALTSVFVVLVGFLGFYAIRFLLVTGNWEPVRKNLTLFMIGSFPRGEQWRILTQIQLITFSIGLVWGLYKSRLRPSEEQQSPTLKTPFWKRYWAAGLLLLVLLLLTKSIMPLLFVLIAIASFTLARFIGKLVPTRYWRSITEYAAALSFILSFQILSGTHGWAWAWTAVITGAFIYRHVSKIELVLWMRLLIAIGCGAIIFGIYQIPIVNFSGVGWEKWSGFHLNLAVTVVAVLLAFPLGILLAI